MKSIRTAFNSIKEWLKGLLVSLRVHSGPNDELSPKKTVFFRVIFAFLIILVFLTVLMQAPMLVEHSINSLTLLFWPILLILLILFDYKSFIVAFLKTALFLIPFIFYLLIAMCFGVNALEGELTRMIFLSAFICVTSLSLAPHISKNNMKLLMISYVVSSIILAVLIYFYSLRGVDISSQVYAYATKNSSAPILFIGAIMTFFFEFKNKYVTYVFRTLINVLVIVLIAIMKCRTVLITLPFVYVILFVLKNPSTKLFLIVSISVTVICVVIFAVPQLRTVVIDYILLNNKANQGTDAVFSGRITLIIKALNNLKPIFGSGDKYVDCVPVQILCSYGIVGTIAIVPYFGMPIYFAVKYKKHNGKTYIFYFYILVLIIFLFNVLFEGHGHFGPGAKSFVLWMFGGFLDKNYASSKLDTVSVKISEKINNNSFVATLSSLSLTLVMCVLCIPSLYQSISLEIYDRIGSTEKTTEYVPIEALTINAPDSMCVGQKISFNVEINPGSATDKQVFWESFVDSYLSIDKLTGLATAKNPGVLNVHAYCYDYKIGNTRLVRVVDQQSYDFSQLNFEISVPNINGSLQIGQKIKIEYDENLFPCSQFISFYSDNDAVDIENGYLIGKHPGSCQVYAKISNDYTAVSNTLSINVQSVESSPINLVELDIDDNIYQNVEYDFNPRFLSGNSVVSNCPFKVDVHGSFCNIKNGKIRFTGTGDQTITIEPLYSINDNYVLTKTFHLTPNPATDLKVESPGWVVLGEKAELKISIIYKNGYSRSPVASEIKPTSSRASNQTSGICDDYFHYSAIKTGNSSVTYDLVGTRIYKKHSFRIYPTEKQTFYKNAKKTAFSIMALLYSAIVLLPSLIIIKNKKNSIVLKGLFPIICLIPFIISIIVNRISVNPIFYLIIVISLILYIILNYVLAKTRYNGLDSKMPVLDKKIEMTIQYFELRI